MSGWFLLRLFLDLLAVSLMLTAYAYNWLGNAAHEIVGTAVFMLLIAHNRFNRRWWGAIARGWRQPRQMLSKAITLSLLSVIGILLITSVIISQTVLSFLPLKTTFTSRQLHTLAAYLALLIVSGHLGLGWSMIMGVVRTSLGLTPSHLRTVVLRALTLVVAAYGIFSLVVLNVGAKLRMEVPMGFADVQERVPVFLAQHIAIVVLCTAAIHTLLKMPACRRKV